MRQLYDKVSRDLSKNITKCYSTSFSSAVKMLSPSIREDIYNIYGFVRLADEVVDTFHDHNKGRMLDDLERDTWLAIEDGISINPVLNSFQSTVRKYNIDKDLVAAFLLSMRMDLEKKVYDSVQDYHQYIFGSADVVGLMCLKVFVKGDQDKYDELKAPAMRLGSAFQKVNFLRDLKNDIQSLERSYFPNVDMTQLSPRAKQDIIDEIEDDFKAAYIGILKLPVDARFGVYTAYRYYRALLKKLRATPSHRIMNERIRVGNHVKLSLLARSYVRNQLNLL
ncbi:MAG: phytoene/squalene synthase family protein [Flavobacteriales bacterium]|nr:phytoene/squalene synthase family protein [Flavobacteriales bacterium]